MKNEMKSAMFVIGMSLIPILFFFYVLFNGYPF